MNTRSKKYIIPIIIVAAICIIAASFIIIRSRKNDTDREFPVVTDESGFTVETDESGSEYHYMTDGVWARVRVESDGNGNAVFVYTDESGETVAAVPADTDSKGNVVAPKPGDPRIPETAGVSGSTAASAPVDEQTWNTAWDSIIGNDSTSDGTSVVTSVRHDQTPDTSGVPADTASDRPADTGSASSQTDGSDTASNNTDTADTADTTSNEWGEEYFQGWY